jgi:acetolactate synthase-1/2/3 large subunit
VKGAELVVEALAAEGVQQVYGIPGTTIMDVLDVFAQQDRVRYLSVRHEQVAAFMADGFSRGSGQVGVCIGSRGPGAANMATAIANAWDESVPLVALIGSVAHDIVERDAFEEMDLLSVFRPITKWAVEVPSAARIPELVQRAIRTARQGRPGPVVVSLPLSVLTAEADVATLPVSRAGLPRPAAADVERAAALLRGAESPTIVVGGGVSGDWDPQLAELADVTGAAVVTTWSRKDRFDNAHPAFLGALGAGALAVSDDAVRDADVLLALGCRFSEFTTKRWTLVQPRTAIVQIDIDVEQIGKIHPVAVGMPADAGLAVADLVSALRAGQPVEERTAQARAARLDRLRADHAEQTTMPGPDPATPPDTVPSAALTGALRELVQQRRVTLVVDAPSTGVWVSRYIDVPRPHSYVASAGGAMAWGFPAALGIALARPAERVVCLSGDGSFWMVAQDLETAVRERIPVVTVVANNSAYGNTRDRQRSAHGGRFFGVFYDNPDLAAFARLHGAHGERVTDPAELLPALQRSLDSGLPAVVDVVQGQHEGLPPGIRPLPPR